MPHFTDDPKVLLRRLRPHVRALLLHELHLDEQRAIVAHQAPQHDASEAVCSASQHDIVAVQPQAYRYTLPLWLCVTVIFVSFHLVFVSVSIASADARICEETDDGAIDGHSPPDQLITIFQRVGFP